MREIRTSGSMSGDGKRSVAEWPKLPRPSSTLPPRRIAAVRRFGRDRSEADMPRASESGSIRRRKTVTRASPRILRAANGRGDALTFRKLALGYIKPVDGLIAGGQGQ